MKSSILPVWGFFLNLQLMDVFRFRFYSASGIVNNGTPIGTDLMITDRELTGITPVIQPYTNDIYNTEGGYSAQSYRKNPTQFGLMIQVVNPLTLQKMDKIHEAIYNAYAVEFACLQGYYNYINTSDDLQNVVLPLDRCTLDVGEFSPRGIKLGHGQEWKRNVQIIVRESIRLTRPTANDIVTISTGN